MMSFKSEKNFKNLKRSLEIIKTVRNTQDNDVQTENKGWLFAIFGSEATIDK
jgi:hypothetical protein